MFTVADPVGIVPRERLVGPRAIRKKMGSFFGSPSAPRAFRQGLAGVNWILRRLISLMYTDVIFTKAGEDSFDYDFLTTIKDVHIKNITFGREFMVESMNKGLENVWVNVTFTLQGGRLYVHQEPIEAKVTNHEMEGIFSYKVRGDTLVQVCADQPFRNTLVIQATQAEGVVMKRYFKRQ
ncbi:hypothetical protein PRIPAC_96024 [Pristionchus pacificus]|uniref:Uncharacterized protein n=1 Tax=Pristionchus pacificus TaxID=54126 RepID=A0A2A6B3C5_PRIPA|nr:hypothetical protein PRIPAC_96024 [Pristionchus pacificus]|eukprot:PDM60368.1 hypothetical protein PRIPAC_54193 [Pristionchus pacificus]